jgi:hypothetical protein
MCKKQHPILLELIQSIIHTKLNERDFSSKELYIDATTSPSKFNSIVYKHFSDIVILDHTYFEPCFSVDPICRAGEGSIMDHQHELSWFHGNAKILAQILIVLLYILLFVGIPLLLIWFIYFIARPTKTRAFKKRV